MEPNQEKQDDTGSGTGTNQAKTDEATEIDPSSVQITDNTKLNNHDAQPSIKPDAVEMEEEEAKKNHRPKAVPVDCAEKIIFFLDISSEMVNYSLTPSRDNTFLTYIKETMMIFLATKKALNEKHQFAVALMQNNGIVWYQEFTNDIEFIGDIVSELQPDEPDDKTESFFDFKDFVGILNEHCHLPEVTDLIFEPPYVIRCIIIYGRSHCTLKIAPEQRSIMEKFKDSPFFFIDILYIHDPPSSDNKAQAIYDFFCDLDKDETGYVLEVSSSIQRLYDNMAKLLCHPLQRCSQTESFYNLIPFENPKEFAES